VPESSDRVSTLQRFTAALSSAVTMRDVARVLFSDGLEQFGARAVGIVWMMRPRSFDLVFGHGVSEEEFRALDEAARRGERLPVRDAIVGRRPIWLETPEEIRAHYPVLEPLRVRRGEAGCAVVPLVIGSWCHGLIGMTFAEPRRLSHEERSFIETLAQLSAHAFERARLFEAEQQARHEAERVGRLQERIMAVVGHDLRTPLSSIQLSADWLAARADLPQDLRKAVQRVRNSAARMQAIVRDLLDVGGARRGAEMSLRRERVDVADVVRRALSEFQVVGIEEGVMLACSGDTRIDADPSRLAQVVSNLVGNAIQHGAGAPVHVEVVDELAAVRLVVQNHGHIDPAILPHLFEPFWRGSPAKGGDEQGGSLGLGLFIVREIVRAHRGTVEVASVPEAGTTFTVRLPRHDGGGDGSAAPPGSSGPPG
jgi:signal transduction histidine kinase